MPKRDIAEVREVLLHEERRRREHRHLLAGVRGHEGRAHRDLGLAEADVAADDPVHGPLALQVFEHLLDRLRLILGLLEREGVGEGLVVELAHGEREPRLGLAPRVEVEELRGHVADLLGGALPGARPLIGAELVERGALGGGTGVTADEVQRVHRDVDAVPVQVLEHQEFSRLPADLERDQPRVAADAVLLVHHGGAGIEILQVAQDRLGIGGGALAPPLLAGPRPEELRLRDHGDRRRGELQALEIGRHREPEPRLASSESVPSRDHRHLVTVGPEHLVQHLAPPGRVGREQHPARETLEEGIERRERLLGTHVDAQLARGGRGEVTHRGAAARELGLGLEGVECDRCEGTEGRLELGGRKKQLRGRKHRALDVVAAVLVARLDVLPPLGEGRRQRRVLHDHRVPRQVVEERRRRIEEQRLVELDPRRRQPLAHAAIDAGARRIPFEACAIAAAELLDRGRIERYFASGEQPHARQRIEGALGLRVEAPDGLDLVVEQVDAERRGAAHGKDVEERPAHRELPGTHDLADARVAGFREALAEGLDGERLTLLELERAALDVAAGRQALHERVGGYDEAAIVELRQLEERLQALGDGVRVGREQLLRQHLPVRQSQQWQRAVREEAQLGGEPLELVH
ncbi:MAG: hypothetical protein E6K45_05410 [Gammaproteobacteria bacterium]|nr:MAG: hypothetical protein E6K45_05410 [Gammaproteobacteria bacterium]